MSEENLKSRLERERRERITQRQTKDQIFQDARGFSQAVALRKSAGNGTHQIAQNIERRQTQSAATKLNSSPPASPQTKQGIPIEFYCFVDGKIATVSIYSVANPQQV